MTSTYSTAILIDLILEIFLLYGTNLHLMSSTPLKAKQLLAAMGCGTETWDHWIDS